LEALRVCESRARSTASLLASLFCMAVLRSLLEARVRQRAASWMGDRRGGEGAGKPDLQEHGGCGGGGCGAVAAGAGARGAEEGAGEHGAWGGVCNWVGM
jgi:hypothetical protein